MKSICVIILLSISLNLLACPFSIIEQDSKFYLILKRVGELPRDKEEFDTKLRRGLQEIKIKDTNEKSNKESDKRKVRVKVIHDSEDRETLEKILKSRCSKSGLY